MNNRDLEKKQLMQEDEYVFPYHYLDLMKQYEHIFQINNSYRQLVCELISPYNGQSVLDAGCGDGRMCYELCKHNLKIHGIDYSERAIAFARIFCPQAEFFIRDLTEDVPPEKYDVIILMEVLEHLRPDKCQQVLCNLKNCLADDGKLIITVPSVRFKLIEKHYQHFSVEQLKTLVATHYKVISITGHLKTGFIRNLRKLLVPLDFLFLPLNAKFPFVKLHSRFMKKLLNKIETCPPEQAVRLIAVCQKLQD